MKIEFDHAKSERNIKMRNLPFDRAAEFDWETAIYHEDERRDYPESRIIALGFLGARLYLICFTPMKDGVRIISFRKANKREVQHYEDETADR